MKIWTHPLIFRMVLARVLIVLIGLVQSFQLMAQDLDPRAYARVPIKATVLVTGYAFSNGNVVTDPSLPLENVKANVHAPSVALLRSFSFFGKTAQVLAALPYAFVNAEGELNGRPVGTSISGFSDVRARFSVLLKGAPAATLSQLRQAQTKQIIGMSLTVTAPIGQYVSSKLVNIGTNRWAFKPEIAISHPFTKKWLLDIYAGVWLFADNNEFFPGQVNRQQKPLGAYQGHLSYNLSLKAWVALDFTYYSGGSTVLNGVKNDDGQANSRIGGTLVFPTGKTSAFKLAVSTGAIVRIGANFTTVSVGWQYSWIKK